METELIGDLSSIHSVGKILLVGEDEEESIAELIFVEHPLQLLTSFRNTFPIIGIDDENDTLSILEI